MWSKKSNEVLLQNPRRNQSKDSTRDLTAAWATFSQTKAALRHIENKLEVAPTSTAVFDSVMDAKKPSASAGRKISRKASRSSSQNKSSKEKSSRSPLRATTLESNVKKSSRVEFREPLASHRDTYSSLSYHGSRQLEAKQLLSSLDLSEAEGKAEITGRVIHDRDEQDLHSRDFESPCSSAADETVVRLEILKQRQHNAKLEKLKERIRKQWEHSEELGGRGQHLGYAEQPIVVTNVENAMTPKVRKVAAAPAAPSYKGFNPAETKIRAPDGKIWHEEEFHIRQELYRDLAFQLTEDSTVKGKPSERNKEKKATRPVRKVQKLTQLSSPEAKQGGNYVISTSSWREGQKLAKKILGPGPRIEQDRRAVSSDRTGRERATKSAGCIGRTGSDSRLDVTHKTSSRSFERPRSKVRSENNLKRLEAALPGGNQEDHASVNKDFLPVEIRGILDDLQLDSMSTREEKDVEKQNHKSVLPAQNARSHSPTKRKPDKIAASEEPQVISKKRHYDTDEVRQYIIRQQEKRKKQQNEEKKAQKEATEQKNKRLQELYRKQKEVFTKVKNVPPPEPSAAKRLQETYSKLLLERTFLEEPPQLPSVQESQPRPGYQPSGESDKENKAQERPPSASSSSDMSLSEPQQPLLRSDLMEPPWVQPDRLSPRVQLSHPQALMSPSGGPCSQHWSLEQMDLLSKECDAMLAGRRSHAAPMGSLTLMPQPYLNSSTAQQNLLVKPTTNQYKSKLDRIEALKATAASLSSRIESEAKKLAGAGINYGTKWNSDHEFMQENQDDGRWAKAVTFDDNLPGIGNLSEFKKLPETIRPHTAAAYAPNKAVIPQESSIDSISEGPLLSDGSFSEEEGGQHKQLPLKTSDAHSKGPWEELAKGSPHSVINIFAKSYQLHGKVFDERLNGGSGLLRPLLPATSPAESVVSYEDDFTSSQGSGTLTDRKISRDLSIAGSSNSSIQEEVPSRKSPHEPRSVELASQHSSAPRSAASSRSSASSKRRGKKQRLDSYNGSSNHFTVEEDKIRSELERGSQQAKKSLRNNRISNKDHEQSPDTDSTLENLSGHSLMSFTDKGRSQKTPTSSPSPGSQKISQFDSIGNTAERVKSPAGFSGSAASGLKPHVPLTDLSLGTSRSVAGAASAGGCMRFSPAGLQHRLSAELNYLSAIEESVRQLTDTERVRGISLAQQESVSLAQILKAQQQRHERDLALLKIKAEQEALESQRQLEEARQKAAQVHAESRQHLVQSRQEAAQETPCKAAAKQTETATHQLREMTELARTPISDTVSAPAAPVTTLFDHQRQHHSEFMKQLRARTDTNSSTSSRQESPSVPSSKENEKKLSRREKITSSIEEQTPTAADDSLPSDSILSLPDEKDSASVATEYSLKFDESMTEDEIEEKSFRSLLPSESHRRNNLEKKRVNRDDSDEEVSPEKTALSSIKELSMPFSGGQDSFSKFTMEMVRQYMKEEEMRAAHQSSLLRLREKALKEKTKAELAWLEHQKKHLRDKGEDDKMPPIRKRQRGLLLRLQQEKAEIKRLQEANKAARKERQLILKQQVEIERIRQTTMKLQEKLKSAGENKLELHSEDDIKQSNGSSPLPTDAETRSPSPVSISSSETSSIMQKLKKMRSRMDEKHCSPVHYFFSVFTSHHWASLSVCFPNLHPKFQLYIYNQLVRFLTKREQKLMQRRQHAEELLEWKRRLDAEEAEVRRIEKQALAAWDKELLKTKIAKKDMGDQRTEPKETASEGESPVPSCSHLNSESSIQEDLGSLPAESVPPEAMGHERPESPDQSTINEEMVYSEDFKSSTPPGKLSPPKSSISVSKQDFSKGSHRTGGQPRSPVKSHQISYNWSDESLSVTQSETTSDQSDIEGRIRALKDELRKRKSVVYQLKKEQKKRQKERLKAQEASLIKQLESYDEFIKKTEEELSQDLETSPTAKPQIKTPSSAAAEKLKIKAPPLHRPETAKNWKSLSESERSRASLESISEHADAVSSGAERSASVHSKKVAVTDVHAEEPSRASSLILMSPRSSRVGSGDFVDNVPSSPPLKDVKDISRISHESTNNVVKASNDEDTLSHESEIEESIKSEEYEAEGSHVKPLESSDVLLTLDKEQESSLDVLPKKVLPSENEHAQKELFGLASESLHSTDEILEQKLTDKDAVTGPSVDESSRKLSRSAEEKDDFEPSRSEDAQSLAEQSENPQASRSGSPSLSSDCDISECLSDRDVEQEQAPTESPLWASVSIVEETDSLPDFKIGFWAGVELDEPEGNNNGTYDESIDSYLDTNKDEDSFFSDRLEKQHKAEQQDRSSKPGKEDESQSRDATENYFQRKAPADTAVSEASAEEGFEESSCKAKSIKEISVATESLAQEQSVVDYLKRAVKEEASLAPLTSGGVDEISAVQLDDDSDFLSEKLERQKTLGEECAEKLDDLSPGAVEKPATPLLDLLTKEKNQLEAQLRLPLRGEEKSKDRLEKQIKKERNEKIQLSNQELCDVKEESGTSSQQVEKEIPDGLNNFFLSSDLEDEREELSSPDMCPRPESPVFGASGQEELAKRLAELELNREFLSVLGDDQDWFDEDYGLSSSKVQQKQAEEPAVLPKVEPQKVPAKPCEEPLAVPHTAVEVESMVHAAAEQLWKLRQLGHDLQSFSHHTDLSSNLKEQDTDTINKQVYEKVVFDLTREIFGAIFAEDPNLNQPVWMKPCRITSAYFRRVKDPNNLDEVKSFIAAEVLKLFSLRKEPNHKTDWQKMMKFGRKKRDRVDHILVQELHEEEAQWVNYDEDELCVKMQLADGIFEALIRDTIDVLNQITEKQRSAWAVEFFASWCGHCVHFAPTWRALAHDIREWRPAVMLAALDCADEANQQVCSNFGITGFPTLKFFKAFSKKTADGIRITNPSATVEDLRHAIITNLEQSREAWPPACPPLEPASAEEVHSFFQRNKDKYLALIFENSNSFVGREVALDMLQYENVAVRRVLSSEEELVKKFGVTTFPSGYLLFRNGSFSRLPVHAEARSFYTYYLRTLLGVTRGSYKLNTTITTSNETDMFQPKHADRSKVYMADLESTLHYSLRVEAARPAKLSGAQLAAFKCYVALLVKYFPGRPCVQTYLQTLDGWLRNWTEPELPRNALKEAVKNNRDASHPAVLPTNMTWVGCQGSEPQFRGYPCGLWTLFHLLTVQAAQSGPDKELPLEVLNTLRCYVRHFFGCRDCAQHFEAMAAKSMDQVAGREESVLWLWSHHNKVNARLAGGDTEDPNFPKLQWPPPDLCPQCHKEERGVHTWDEPAVLTFLKGHFSPANIHLDYVEADPIPGEGIDTRLGTEGPREEREKEEEEKETESEMRAPGRPGSPEPRRPSIVRLNPKLREVGEDIVDLDSFSEQHFKSQALRAAAGRRRRISKRDTIALPRDARVGRERRRANVLVREDEEEVGDGVQRSPWLKVLGLGFSRLDISLCVALYFLSSMCLLGMYTFFRLRTRARKGRPSFPVA
ncbi:centrosome-associated protein 350 isoform F [Patagioenas fasciata monilis]|uniref:Sulfhydryl oxidase n=1 Tax=Patagioenas fasciata monilis TaxID=372326 RepID=A0A1V4JYY7_PATFA|nr:centrosome-associated protein 350 isoform F [Patagioenas fasciata monilis]